MMAPGQRTATATRPERTGEGLRPSDGRRHLRVVRPQDRARHRFRLTPRAGVTMTVALFGGLFAVAGSHALLIESQARLDRLDDQVAEQEARYERQRLEVAQLESPERILADAAEQGMVAPDGVTWVSPDRPSSGTPLPDDPSDEDSTSTSWEDVKSYLGSTP